jgi:RHS repeat-associated protein
LVAKDGVILENAGDQHFYPYGSSVEGEIDDAGYTGHKFDTDLGLSYMQARYYDPMIGRFYSNDPVDMLGHMGRGNPVHGFGRYTYANNNPYKYTDPDGEFAFLIPLIGGAIGGVTAYNEARDAGLSKLEAAGVGAVGALIGTLSGGTSGLAVSTTIKATAKVAAQKAVQQTTTQTAAKLAGSATSGAVSGAVVQAGADASGDISNQQPVDIDGGKVFVKGAEGAVTGLMGGAPAALAGKSLVTEGVGAGITLAIESQKIEDK